jgi:putative transposase
MKTYCFKLYNSKKNKRLHELIDIAGQIYNHLIAVHKRYYRLYGKHLNVNKLMKHITKLKKQEKFAFWNKLGSQSIQDIAQRIERSYKLFFENKKRSIKTSPPSFKKIIKYKSFTLKQAGYKFLEGNKIVIIGNTYKYSKSRNIEGKIKTLTIKRDSLGNIYIYIVCETNTNKTIVEPRSGKNVGLDFGLKKFLTASDGKIIESPLFFKQNIKEIRKLHRSLSRKKKGSNNYKRALISLTKAYKKTANCRKDYHFKLAKKLAEGYALICIEDLDIKAMQKAWGRKISDLGHSQFVNILKYQCAKTGSKVIEIPRFYPSSKTCSNCGYILNELPLNVRSWICPTCGEVHNRDINAAKNILRVGASTLWGEEVRPTLVGVLR